MGQWDLKQREMQEMYLPRHNLPVGATDVNSSK